MLFSGSSTIFRASGRSWRCAKALGREAKALGSEIKSLGRGAKALGRGACGARALPREMSFCLRAMMPVNGSSAACSAETFALRAILTCADAPRAVRLERRP